MEQNRKKAFLLAVDTDGTAEASLAELELLCETAGTEVVGTAMQARRAPDPKSWMGRGKIEEVHAFCEQNEVDLVICDDELSGSTIKTLEDLLDLPVIDRTTVILDIFASRARSAEGRLQVELAQLQYRLPRLSGMGGVLSRLGGGIGTRGPGETKLETDRRHIRRRITNIENRLEDVSRRRAMLRERRKKDARSTAALVGYTNAGKSTLMNALCGSDVYVQDQLFATLDPTLRRMKSAEGEVTLVDTVGFIRKLPHTLIEAFKSTLEESLDADLLLIVCDGSDPDCGTQLEIVEQLLHDLGAEAKQLVYVFNKNDRPVSESAEIAMTLRRQGGNDVFSVSAQRKESLIPLKETILSKCV